MLADENVPALPDVPLHHLNLCFAPHHLRGRRPVGSRSRDLFLIKRKRKFPRWRRAPLVKKNAAHNDAVGNGKIPLLFMDAVAAAGMAGPAALLMSQAVPSSPKIREGKEPPKSLRQKYPRGIRPFARASRSRSSR
jgi:hypothetical protein